MKIAEDKSVGSETITVWIRQDLIALTENIAQKAQISKNKVIKNIIEIGLGEIRAQRKIGLVKLNFIIAEYKDKLKVATSALIGNGIGEIGVKKGMSITIRLDKDVCDQLNHWSEYLDLTRSKLVQHLFDMIAVDLRRLVAIGGLDVVMFIENLKISWKKSFENADKTVQDKTLKFDD